MVGFGLCGLVGLSFGLLNNGGYTVLLLALVGLLISAGCGVGIYHIVRAMRRPSDQPTDKELP